MLSQPLEVPVLPAVVPSLSLRHCLGHFATGVTVVTYLAADRAQGVTVNSFTSVSLDPPLVLVCLDKRSKSISHLAEQPFAVNVLHSEQRPLALHFAGRPYADGQPDWVIENTVPRIKDSLAWLVCDPWQQVDAGDHLIVVGRVTGFDAQERDPLCFYRGQFTDIGVESKNVPDGRVQGDRPQTVTTPPEANSFG